MNWYKHYMGDYTRDTAHLTIIQHGVYRLMLDHYYSTEKSLPTDLSTIYRVVRAITPDEQQSVESILQQFFIKESDGYHNNRVDEELEKYASQVDHNRSVGKLGGRPKNPEITQVVTESKPGNNPSGSEMETRKVTRSITRKEPNPDTRYQIPDTTGQNPESRIQNPEKNLQQQLVPSAPSRFDEFWQLYPVHRDKQKAMKTWKARKLDSMADKILHDVRERKRLDQQWAKGFTPHPTTYLNGSRWEDEFAGRPKKDGYTEFLEGYNAGN